MTTNGPLGNLTTFSGGYPAVHYHLVQWRGGNCNVPSCFMPRKLELIADRVRPVCDFTSHYKLELKDTLVQPAPSAGKHM